jgi:hypothetical protein
LRSLVLDLRGEGADLIEVIHGAVEPPDSSGGGDAEQDDEERGDTHRPAVVPALLRAPFAGLALGFGRCGQLERLGRGLERLKVRATALTKPVFGRDWIVADRTAGQLWLRRQDVSPRAERMRRIVRW